MMILKGGLCCPWWGRGENWDQNSLIIFIRASPPNTGRAGASRSTINHTRTPPSNKKSNQPASTCTRDVSARAAVAVDASQPSFSSYLSGSQQTRGEMKSRTLSGCLSIIRSDGTSPRAPPRGFNTPGPPWTPTGRLPDPRHTRRLSLSLSVAVTHADEMFFNTQSTVLTSPWVAGSPLEGRKGIDFWGRLWFTVLW